MEQNTPEPPKTNPQPAPAAPPPPPQPTTAAPVNQSNLEGVTINTASVESKAGLYTKVTFVSLWVLVFATTGFLTSLIHGSDDVAGIIVFFVSVALIATPVFVIANSKRGKELKANPALIEDVFVKKYLRKNLFLSVVATAIAAFYFVYITLSTVFVNDGSSDGATKSIMTALVYTLGFGAILAFCWIQHARTTK